MSVSWGWICENSCGVWPIENWGEFPYGFENETEGA